jgi:hypothetical protein
MTKTTDQKWFTIRQNRICLFGKITDDNMILNDAGKMIEKWYFDLENNYPNTKCREFVANAIMGLYCPQQR